MSGQKLRIIFIHDKAYLTQEQPLTFRQLGLPETAKSFKAPSFWKIRVLNYIDSEKKIYCEILSYDAGNTEFPINQKQNADILKGIQNITFRSIDTGGLLRTLATETPILIIPAKETPIKEILAYRQEVSRKPIKQHSREPIEKIIEETFSVPLKNVHFKLGRVNFEKKFKDYYKTIELSLSNSDIIEAFDSIKNYFGNVLNVLAP